MPKPATQPNRGGDGRFVRSFDRRTLYEIARRVALAAARILRKEPTELTHREWNAGRRHLRHVWPRIPQAHEICRQLADYDGSPITLSELLRAVFSEANIMRYDTGRLRAPERAISKRYARYGLRRVAFALRAKTLNPLEYETGREQLLHLARRRSPADERALRELLPTVVQILSCYGRDWDAALAGARLAPRPRSTAFGPGAGVSAPIAIAIYFAEMGATPTTATALRRFAATRFSLEVFRGSDWEELFARGLREIEALHLPGPPPPGQRLPNHQPIELNLGKLPPPRKQFHTLVEIIEWGIRFREWVGGGAASDSAYRRFRVAHPDAPHLRSFHARGGLQAILRESTTRGWRKRAEANDEAARLRRSEAAPRDRMPPPPGPPPEERREQILAFLKTNGPSPLRTIAAELGISSERVRVLILALEQAGLVMRTQQNPRSPKQAWALTSSGRRRAART